MKIKTWTVIHAFCPKTEKIIYTAVRCSECRNYRGPVNDGFECAFKAKKKEGAQNEQA